MKLVTLGLAMAAALGAATAAGAATSARGSGQITFSSSREHISFTTSGLTGKAVVVDHTAAGTVVFHLDIDCVAIVGTQATISGIVTQSTNTELVPTGFQGVFRVVDNGQSGQSPPDLMSLVNVYAVGTGVDCLVPGEYDLVPIEGGNIEIG
jgi:hypothetical protein